MNPEGSAHFSWLGKLIPASLFGRMVLILLGGLLVSQLLNFVFIAREHENILQGDSTRQIERRIAELAAILDRVRAADRPMFAEAVSARELRIYLGDPPAGKIAPRQAEMAQEIRASLESALGTQRLRGLEILETPASDFAPKVPGPGDRHYTLRAGLTLADGSSVTLDIQLMHGSSWLTSTSRSTIELGLRLAIILAACLVAVRLATRPVMTLGRAARELGENLNAPPMRESGSEEIRAAARAFNHMQRKLQTFVEERTRMLAAVSHDLKTPITRMRLRAEQIPDVTLREKFEHDLHEMEELVSGTLDFMRNLEMEKSERLAVDLNAMLESIVEDRQEAGQPVTLAGETAKPVLAYPQAIKRCVENLIDNAIKYGAAARIELSQSENATSIAVKDSGPGIPDAELEKVFEPFYRLEASRNRDTGGSGLGLSIARNIARAHGGDIVLGNLEPRGLGATLVLPR
jgi:signal transduction histidine kinase